MSGQAGSKVVAAEAALMPTTNLLSNLQASRTESRTDFPGLSRPLPAQPPAAISIRPVVALDGSGWLPVVAGAVVRAARLLIGSTEARMSDEYPENPPANECPQCGRSIEADMVWCSGNCSTQYYLQQIEELIAGARR